MPADLSVAGLAQTIDSLLKAVLGVAVPKLELTLSLLSLVAVAATGIFVLKLCTKVLKEEIRAFQRLFASHSAPDAGPPASHQIARLREEMVALKQRHEALLRETASPGACETACGPGTIDESPPPSLPGSPERGLVLASGAGEGPHLGKDRTVIIGVGRMARLAAAEARHYRSENIEVVGFLGECPGASGRLLEGYPVLGCGDQLRSDLRSHRVDAVLVAGDVTVKGVCREEDIVALCREMDARCYRFRSGWRHLLGPLPGITSAGGPVEARPREKAIVLGAGPFAHLAAREALFCLAHRVEVAGFTDKDRSKGGQPFESARILGSHDDLEAAVASTGDVSLALIATHEISEGSAMEQRVRDVCRKASLSLFRFETAWERLEPALPPAGAAPSPDRKSAHTPPPAGPAGGGSPSALRVRGPGF